MKAMLTKILSVLLVVTITAGVAITGTLAYLTDRDSEANVFTVGDVSIDLKEDFEQGAELLPGVTIEKKPTITNTGKNDAYVWATVAVPGNLDEAIAFLEKNETEWDWTSVANAEDVEINGAKYTVLTALYNTVLAKDAETPALFTGVALDKTVDIDPNGDWYTVNAGVAESLGWNNSNGNPVIYVSAYAMQTEGFNTALDAYTAYNAQWTTDGGENKGLEWGELPVSVANSEELATAVANGATNLILADGEYKITGCAGKTLTIHGSENAVIKVMNQGEDGCDYSFGSGGAGVGNITFNGVTIDTTENTGNYKGFAYMKGTFNNCNFVGAYSLNNANDFVFNNCTFDFKDGYIWTWSANSVTFDGCTFNGKSKAILAHGWASTVININNCTFAATEKGFASGGTVWTAAVEIDPAGSNTYTINFTGENTKTEFYADWTRIKDGSTGHTITGLN